MSKIIGIEQGNPDITSKIKDIVLKQIVPERKDEIENLFNTYSIQIRSQSGVTSYRAESGMNTVFLSDQTLIINNLITKFFYQALKENSCLLFCDAIQRNLIKAYPIKNLKLLEKLKNILFWNEEIKTFESYILDDSFFTSTVEEMFKEPITDEEKCIRDLNFISLAFIVLHEFAHIIKGYGSTIEDELLCDKYAREFIFEKIDNYILSENDKKIDNAKNKMINKRFTGVNTAHLIIGIVEQISHTEKKTHPELKVRLKPFLDLAKSFNELDYNVTPFINEFNKIDSQIFTNLSAPHKAMILRALCEYCGPVSFWNTLACSIMLLLQIKGIAGKISPSVEQFCFDNLELI